MSQTHIHLLITHLPVFGTISALLVLIYGVWCKSNPTKSAAYLLFILSSVGAVISYFTGEAAEESVEKLSGITKSAIDRHEDFATIGFAALVVLGVTALVALFLTLRKSAFSGKIAYFTLLVSIVSCGLIGWTAYLGGQIRHTEIGASVTKVQEQTKEKDDD